MATLADMKARIISDTLRPDLADAIAREITSAINFYRSKRFYFTEKDTEVLFNTVAGQSEYGAAAQASIPNLIRIDSISLDRDGRVLSLGLINELAMQRLLGDSGALSGDPTYYAYYGQRLRLYAIPDGIYPVRIAGVIRVAAPASDDEEGNPWMNDAEELIRMRAESKIWSVSMGDVQTGAAMRAMEEESFQNLLVETSSRTQVDTITSECL